MVAKPFDNMILTKKNLSYHEVYETTSALKIKAWIQSEKQNNSRACKIIDNREVGYISLSLGHTIIF